MLDEVRALVRRVDALRRELRRFGSAEVRRQRVRNEAQAIVDSYFRRAREQMRIGGIPERMLRALDEAMHHLLEVSHRRSSGTTYAAALDTGLVELRRLEHVALESGNMPRERVELSPTDNLIVRTLSSVVPSAARAYEQALLDLRGPDRLSWRGPATDLREALRETLDHLASDDDVSSAPGFRLERDATGPTMKQKVRFVLGNRRVSRSAMAAPESAVSAVEEMLGTYVRSVYTRSSVSTHTPTERDEVLRILEYVRVALCELLEIRPHV
jgi:hypothetical protein